MLLSGINSSDVLYRKYISVYIYIYIYIYTVSQKNPCDYVFDDKLNSRRPIVIIFGTVIT